MIVLSDFGSTMFSLYKVYYPNVCKLLEIIFINADKSGHLKRSYSKVIKLYPKDNPENMHTSS